VPRRQLRAAATGSLEGGEHEPGNVLAAGSGFWCSPEHPVEASLTLALDPPRRVCGIRVRFRPWSTFFLRSGVPTVPEATSVELVLPGMSADGAPEAATPAAPATVVVATLDGTAAQRLLWSSPTDLAAPVAASVTLRMRGDARWFSVSEVELLEPEEGAPPLETAGPIAAAAVLAPAGASGPAALPPRAQAVVDAVRSCLDSFAPHALSKRFGVHYGLLDDDDDEAAPPRQESAARRLLAVPFLGRGVPSPASEFASPDAALAFAVAAYAHQGLRLSDARRLLAELRDRMTREPGPVPLRPAHRLFASWAESGKASAALLPLHLLSPGERGDVAAVRRALGSHPAAVRWYVAVVALPEALRVRRWRLTATGEELGWQLTAAARLGFSGTPSSRLPAGMGGCKFEPASEALVPATMTDPSVCGSPSSPTAGP